MSSGSGRGLPSETTEPLVHLLLKRIAKGPVTPAELVGELATGITGGNTEPSGDVDRLLRRLLNQGYVESKAAAAIGEHGSALAATAKAKRYLDALANLQPSFRRPSSPTMDQHPGVRLSDLESMATTRTNQGSPNERPGLAAARKPSPDLTNGLWEYSAYVDAELGLTRELRRNGRYPLHGARARPGQEGRLDPR